MKIAQLWDLRPVGKAGVIARLQSYAEKKMPFPMEGHLLRWSGYPIRSYTRRATRSVSTRKNIGRITLAPPLSASPEPT